MKKISVYKNTKTGKYYRFGKVISDVSNIEDADKYNINTGLITGTFGPYERVNYQDELIIIRKEKLIKLHNL